MSTNKHKPHLYVIPEDRRNEQIANGFAQHPSVTARQIQVVQPAGGWSRVIDTFKAEYVPLMEQNLNTHVVLLIDFDDDPEQRWNYCNSGIPEGLRDRVFVVGPRNTPETLRQSLGKTYEEMCP